MQYSLLGATGVEVSTICLGTATFGVAPLPAVVDRVVGTGRDLGVTSIETEIHLTREVHHLSQDRVRSALLPGVPGLPSPCV